MDIVWSFSGSLKELFVPPAEDKYSHNHPKIGGVLIRTLNCI